MRFIYVYNFILFFVFIGCDTHIESHLEVGELSCEHLTDPFVIQHATPAMSWKLNGNEIGKRQSAYQIIVASSLELLNQDSGDLWNSQKVPSIRSLNITYSGKELTAGQRCFWKVRVWDERDQPTSWSAGASWSMGLNARDWSADWIGYNAAALDSNYKSKPWANGMHQVGVYRPLPCPYLRSSLTLESVPDRALAYISSLGIYELYVNGERVGEDVFTSGWSDYNKRVYYNTYDIAPVLKEGNNEVQIVLAGGWYSGVMYNKGMNFYGEHPKVRAEVHVADSVVLRTNDAWVVKYLAIEEADFQGGETYDARKERVKDERAGAPDSSWVAVNVYSAPAIAVEAYPAPPVKKQREVECVSVTKRSDGKYIADMGENFAGWVGIRTTGNRGDSVIMRFGEMLNPDGSLHTRNLRTARATDTYVLKGTGVEIWEPRFTYHGFRYVEIQSSNPIESKDITGVAISSDLPSTGTFSCSNDTINRLHQNIQRSLRSNYLEVPTDCPQRDERLGWAGDAQLILKTGMYNFDNYAFMRKWLDALVDGQFENGRIPSTAPVVASRVTSGWGDAIVICPWEMFEFYGDTQVLARYYPSMIRWVDFLEQNRSPEFINLQSTYGDWHNDSAETPHLLISTAYYKRSVDIMQRIAQTLNDNERAGHYSALSGKISQAFLREFVDDSLNISGRTQAAYLFALAYELVPDSLRSAMAQRLIESIEERNNHLSTGILGTKLLLPTLTDIDRSDLAYRLLLNETYPSWGYQLVNGATTIWERWDGFTHDVGIHEDSTNSFNHYALGSVGEWFYSDIGGIAPLEPGFKRISIKPRPGHLDWAKVSYNSVYGMIRSNWKHGEDGFDLEVEIPPNATGVVYLPLGAEEVDGAVLQKLSEMPGVQASGVEGDRIVLEIESGTYQFHSAY